MARLTAEEEAVFKKLQQKREAPDAPPIGRSVNFNVDLGDKAQVEMAKRFGLLNEEPEEASEEEEAPTGNPPKRRGFFDAAA